MDDRFEQEFYGSPWQRVLPLGPGGIQPYVRTAGGSSLLAATTRLRRTMLAWLGGGMIGLGRRATSAMAERPLPRAPVPRLQQRPRLAHAAARPAGRRTTKRRLSEAA